MNPPIRFVPTRLDLIRELPPGSVGVEVGVLRGDFSAEILTTPVSKLYLVDAWERQTGAYELDVANNEDHVANERRVRDRFKDEPRAQIIKGYSDEAFCVVPEQMDFCYLDASHDYRSVWTDLINWGHNSLKDDTGVFFLHDFTVRPEAVRQGFGVVQAVFEFCHEHGWKITAMTEEEWPTVKLERV